MSSKQSGGGFANLRKAIDDLSGIQAKTGWPESATYPDGTKVVDVAMWQEFGNSRIPPRPFVRVAIASNQQQWLDSLGQGAQACINGQANARAVLESTALLAAGDIGKAIKAITAPALKPQTIRRKGFDKPLIDTGQMFQSVTGVVEDA